MICYIRRRNSTQEVLVEKSIDDNWWDVYLKAARMDGRRIVYHSNESVSIIYTEKGYTVTLTR